MKIKLNLTNDQLEDVGVQVVRELGNRDALPELTRLSAHVVWHLSDVADHDDD